VKLATKGDKGNDFASFQHTPSVRASAESSVVLSAYQMALETVLASVTVDNSTAVVLGAQMENYLALRKLAEQIREDVDRGDIVLQVIETRLMTVSNGTT
jgi:hypothetical protein